METSALSLAPDAPAAAPVKRARKPRAARKSSPRKAAAVAPVAAPVAPSAPMTLSRVAIALCCGLPLTTFAMTWLASESFMGGQTWLGCLAACVALFMLGVSMPHCADAIGHEWKTSARDAWFVAAALEMSIVVLDLTHLAGPTSLREPALWAMAVPCVMIALLNTIAVRHHKPKKGQR